MLNFILKGLKFFAYLFVVIYIIGFIITTTISIGYLFGLFDEPDTLGVLCFGLSVIMVLCCYLWDKYIPLYFNNYIYYFGIIYWGFAQIFGEYLDFYEKIPHFDTLLHTTGGAFFFILGFTIVTQLVKKEHHKHVPVIVFVGFAFFMSVSCAVFWEFFEFSVDFWLGGNMQVGIIDPNHTYDYTQHILESGRFMDPALLDTIKDMLVHSLSAIAISLFSLKYFDLMINTFSVDSKKEKDC